MTSFSPNRKGFSYVSPLTDEVLQKYRCPWCKHKLDCHKSMGDEKPCVGDISLCGYCGELFEFDSPQPSKIDETTLSMDERESLAPILQIYYRFKALRQAKGVKSK